MDIKLYPEFPVEHVVYRKNSAGKNYAVNKGIYRVIAGIAQNRLYEITFKYF